MHSRQQPRNGWRGHWTIALTGHYTDMMIAASYARISIEYEKDKVKVITKSKLEKKIFSL